MIIIIFAIFIPGGAVKRYYRIKGRNLPTTKCPLESKFQQIISFWCLLIFGIIYVFLVPFFLIFDVYHLFLDWSTLTFLIVSSNLLLTFQIVGTCLFVIGNVIYIAGRLVIKEYFSELWKPAKVGEGFAHSGIYTRLRHPLYFGGFMMYSGLILMFQTWLGLLLFIPPMAIMIKAAFNEEKWMIEQYGEEYKKYMEKTWRFFPKLS